MKNSHIVSVQTRDVRFPLSQGAGSDAVHSGAEYAFATTLLATESGLFGTGIVLTLGQGNHLVCEAIELLGAELTGLDIEESMADFGALSQRLAQHPQLRWLGPQKGVVHLALASLTNACFDLWAKARGVPLWRLLLDLNPEQLVKLLDLSYLEDVFTKDDALAILQHHASDRAGREKILQHGYPGYDTSVGWFQYDDGKIKQLAKAAMDRGFRAFKLKVGSPDQQRDLRRATILRELIGRDALLMVEVTIKAGGDYGRLRQARVRTLRRDRRPR
jgi:L-fuconate dehydratase